MTKRIIFSTIIFLILAAAGSVSAAAIAPEITVSPDSYLAGGETLYLQGTAQPNGQVIVLLRDGQEEIKSWTVKSNADGEWYLISNDPIKNGKYVLTASTEDGGQAVYSAGRSIDVSSSGVFFLGPLGVLYKNLVFALIAILAVSFALFLNFRIRLKKTRSKIAKEAKEARSVCGIVFGGLSERVERRMKMVDGQPGFSPEEKKAFEDIKEILEASRILIEKEISDVERSIK